MTANVVVEKSKIDKRGVFAARDFKKGEIVLKWRPRILEKSEVDKLSSKAKNHCDVAIRDIKAGEEITSNYSKNSLIPFKCKCGSKKCRERLTNFYGQNSISE